MSALNLIQFMSSAKSKGKTYTLEQASLMLRELTNLRVSLRMAAEHKADIKELHTGVHKHAFDRSLLIKDIPNPGQDPDILAIQKAADHLKDIHRKKILTHRQNAQTSLTNLLNLQEEMGEKNFATLFKRLTAALKQNNPERYKAYYAQFVKDVDFISHNKLFPKAKAVAALKKLGLLGMGVILTATAFFGFNKSQPSSNQSV